MTTFIDFADLKKKNPIEDVARRLGLELKANKNQFRCPCPSGEGDDRSLVVTPAKGVWFSFAKQIGGDCIKLVEFALDLPPKEAAQWIVGDTVPTVPAKGKEEVKPCDGFSPLTYLEADHPAVEAIGIETEVADFIGCGFAPRGIMKGTIAIPIRLDDGTLIGYIGVTDIVLPPTWSLPHE